MLTAPGSVTRFDDADGRWQSLSSASFYSSAPWLQHCRLYEGGTCVGVGVAEDDEAAGLALTALEADPPANYDFVAKYRASGLEPPDHAATIGGPRLGYQTTLLRSGGADDELVRSLLSALREQSALLRGREECPVVAMYLSTDDVRLLWRAGVVAETVFLEPEAWFRLPEGGWEGYLASLSASRRHKVRRETADFARAGCTIAHQPLSEVVELLPALAESMAIKYGYPTRAPRFRVEFGRYLEATGDLARVAMCRHGRHTLGFMLYYVWAGCIYLRWASFDYSRLTDSFEYFNLSMYSQIAIAEDVGARLMHAGKNALDAKVLRGATLTPMWMLELREKPVPGSEAREEAARRANEAAIGRYRDHPILGPAIENPAEWEI
jgi:hypothetical protein